MKRIFLLSTFIIFASFAKANSPDSIYIRLYYSSSFKDYEEQEQILYDESILDISQNLVHFYSRYSSRRYEIVDSIMTIGGNIGDVINAYEKTGFPSPIQHYQVWKHLPSYNHYTFMDKIGRDIVFEDSLVKPKWELCNKDSLVLGYQCKMATTLFLGRLWTGGTQKIFQYLKDLGFLEVYQD